MDQNAQLRHRTDQILRQKISLGMTGGRGVQKKNSMRKCRTGTRAIYHKSMDCKKTGRYKTKKGQVCNNKKKRRCRVPAGSGIMAGDLIGGEGIMAGCMDCGATCENCGSGEGRMRHTKRSTGVRRKTSGSKTMKSHARGAKRSTNPWITFLKKMVRETGVPYNELLRDPHMKKLYHSM